MGRKKLDLEPVKIRLTGATIATLEARAKEHGVNVNAEIANRLRKTIEDDRTVDNVLENRVAIGVAKLLAGLADQIGRVAAFQSTYSVKGSVEWFNDPYAFDMVVRAVNRLLAMMRPDGEIKQPKPFSELKGAAQEKLANDFADEIIRQFVMGDLRFGDAGDKLEDARTDLGDLYPRLHERIGA